LNIRLLTFLNIHRTWVLPPSTVNMGADDQQIELTFRVRPQLLYPEYRKKEGEHISE
jgi:hypothetical protein